MRKTGIWALFVAAYVGGVYLGDNHSPSSIPSVVAVALTCFSIFAAALGRFARFARATSFLALAAFGFSRLPSVDWPDESVDDAECTGTMVSAVQGTAGVSTFIVDAVNCYRGRDPTPIAQKIRVSVALSDLAVRTGDRLRLFGKLMRPAPAMNAGESDRARALAREGIRYEFRVRNADALEIEGESTTILGAIPRAAEDLRNRLIARLRDEPSRATAALVAAILLGDRRALAPDVVENYTNTGILHIIAVSGLHLVFAMWLFVKIGRFLARRFERVLLSVGATKFSWLFAFPAASFYVLVTGSPASAVRAWVMLAISALALLAERRCSSTRALVLTVLIITVVDPAALYDVSFILSVVSVVAIIGLTPGLTASRGISAATAHPTLRARLLAIVVRSVRHSSAATLGTAPFTAYFFQRIAVAGLLANLILIPIGSLLLVTALAWGTAELFVPAIASQLLSLPLFLARVFNLITAALGGPSESLCLTFAPSLVQTLVLVGAISLFAMRSSQRGLLTVSLLLFAVSFIVELSLRESRAPRNAVRVTFLAVGQGDSTLIEFPNGAVMLVDAGGSLLGDDRVGARVVVPYLRRNRISRVDWAIVTHPHNDHASGLTAVVKSVKVGEVWANGQPWEGSALERLRRELDAREIPVRVPPPIPPCDHSEFWICLVHPITPRGTPNFFDDLSVNSNSLVFRLSIGALRLLLTGDIERDAELDLAESRIDLRAEILKVPHHGSRTSSTYKFLRAVRPTVAIASLGRANPFHFPHGTVVSRYRRLGVPLYRTDSDGQVSIVITPTHVRLTTLRSREPIALPQQIHSLADNPSIEGESG
ncbi:MAG: DNA internalization-related competence protein ComEC/Rec2 [Deltaproteobacteria bacterium]|nr:DNA internalization-related competence protein ComEC/Rec2 [Deltaproteobacteria bacterium]